MKRETRSRTSSARKNNDKKIPSSVEKMEQDEALERAEKQAKKDNGGWIKKNTKKPAKKEETAKKKVDPPSPD